MVTTKNVDRMLTSSRYIKNSDLHGVGIPGRVDCSTENLVIIKFIQKDLFKTYALAKQKGYISQWVRRNIPRIEGQFVVLSGCMLDRYRSWYEYLQKIIKQCEAANTTSYKGVCSNFKHAQELYDYCKVIKTTLSLIQLCFIYGVKYNPVKFKSVKIVIEKMRAQVSGYLSLIPKKIRYENGRRHPGTLLSRSRLGAKICSMVNIQNLTRPLRSLTAKKIIDGIDSKKPDPGRNRKFKQQISSVQPSITNRQMHAGLMAHRKRIHDRYKNATAFRSKL